MSFIKNINHPVNLKKIMNHSICWVLYMIYELFLLYYTTGRLPSIGVYLFYYCCNVALFYSQVGLLTLTLGHDKPNYIKLFVLIFAEIIGFLIIKMTADFVFTDFSHIGSSVLRGMKAMATLDLLRIIYFAAFGTLFWAINNINNYQKKADAAEIKSLKNARDTADLEVKLAKSQNAYLQQQINPHLLFNSLNFIHGTVYKLSHEAADNIVLLSDIMRYSLEETEADGKINLIKEAEQIENLIKINRFRFDYPIDVLYIKQGDLSVHNIIPLVLMTLTENLFKHGDLKNKQAIIRLTVTENGELSLYTYNHKRPTPPFNRVKSIGIENVRIRLNFTYGSDYKLSINQNDETYESELIIQL